VLVTITAVAGTGSASAALSVNPVSLWYFTLYPTAISGGTSSTANWIYLAAASPAAGTTVTLSSSNPAVASVPATVRVPGGASSVSFSIATTSVTAATTVTITASAGGVSKNLPLTVNPPQLKFFTLYPTTISGGLTATANYVYLTSAAPAGGMTVNLTSSNTAVAQVPATVTIPGGSDSAMFSIATSPVSTSTEVTITAGAGGVSQNLSLNVTVPQVKYFTLYPTTISGGKTSTANFVYLTSAAPAGGVIVNMSSTDPATAQVPATILVPTGSSSASFSVTTTSVTAQKAVTIAAATSAASARVDLTVTPPYVTYMTVWPSNITGGTTATANFVYLSSPAPPGGVAVSFTSSNPNVAQAPAPLIVPAGANSATFRIVTSPVLMPTPITITASGGGAQPAISFTVTPSDHSSAARLHRHDLQ
jgi:hypothetical protein